MEITIDAIYAGEAQIVIEALVHSLIEWDKKLPADIVDRLIQHVETDNPEKPYTMDLRGKLIQK